MDNGLIFPYHHVRAPADPGVLRKAPSGAYRPHQQ